MRKFRTAFVLLLSFFIVNTGFVQDEHDAAQLLGRVHVKMLQSSPRFGWFSANYTNYTCQASAIEQLTKITPAISFIAFAGTWDNASQQLLPQFYRSLDEAKINRARVLLYFLDRDKKSPQGFEGEYLIHTVPCFIILKGGEEIGRISGNQSTSIEGQLADILLK